MSFGSVGFLSLFVALFLFRIIPIAFGVWLFFTVQRMRRDIATLQRRVNELTTVQRAG